MNTFVIRTLTLSLAALLTAGCSAAHYRGKVNRAAYTIIEQKQREALGRTEPFSIESPEQQLRRKLLLDQNLPTAGPASFGVEALEPIAHWPEDEDPVSQPFTPPAGPVIDDQPVTITLVDALQIAAKNNRDYQTNKETVFRAALDLEFERDQFRNTFTGLLEGTYTQDRTATPLGGDVSEGVEGTVSGGVTRRFLNGMTLSGQLGWDVARLLAPEQFGSRSLFGDASITIPLLRGAGRHIVGEPLKQAERNVLYAIYNFETFKRTFSVQVASAYLAVLQALDEVKNSDENYRGLIASTRRARRLGDAGIISPVQVDQSIQDELSARDRWIRSRENFASQLDSFKVLLGLPTDARIALDRADLEQLAERAAPIIREQTAAAQDEVVPPGDAPIILVEPDRNAGGKYEIPEERAIDLGLEHRLDLRVTEGAVYDAQRAVVVAANALKPELTLLGQANFGERRSLGSASAEDADSSSDLDFDRGLYAGILTLDLPLERTDEALNYRERWIDLERAVRDAQALEDEIKLDVRNGLRNLLEARESLQTQSRAVALAQRRVRSTQLYLEAGRVEIRDLLEAQEALLGAQNALTAAMVDYRVTELELQRDMGVLQVNEQGLWSEFDPMTGENS